MSGDNKSLIKLLEAEMQKDISSINFDAADESSITIDDVLLWYTEAEKLIRVLANILGVPMIQSINQLRYAGHHILKAQCSKATEMEKKQNLIESYKHCKRAVYDALDFYVYKLNDFYRVVLPALKQEKAVKAERNLKDHIKNINSCRSSAETRITYYTNIHNSLIKGLDLVEELNEFQRETGLSKDIFIEKKDLCFQISYLSEKVKEFERKEGSRFNKIGLWIALIIALGTPISIAITAFITSHHEVVYSQKQQKEAVTVPNSLSSNTP